MPYERRRDGFLLTTDAARITAEQVERFLQQSYWASQRARDTIERSLQHSLCFMLVDTSTNTPAGFSRIVTDYATFAWLCDVFVEQRYRGRGLGTWMLEGVFAHPSVQELRRWLLATADAHGVYERFGFHRLARPERWMERLESMPA